jgi:hypothetical protein
MRLNLGAGIRYSPLKNAVVRIIAAIQIIKIGEPTIAAGRLGTD